MVKVKDIFEFIDSISPYSLKCEWDNCGLLVGDEEKEVKKIGFCLDATSETLNDAIKKGVDLIVTHHPVIFKAQKNFLKGNIPFEAAKNGISIVSAHTCFDCAKGGVNDILAEILELKNITSIETEGCAEPMLRIGEINETSSLEFSRFVAERLGTICRVIDCSNKIKKVALCGGAGMDFAHDAKLAGADAYVTGDISHHQMLGAKEIGLTVIAAGHFETEKPAMLKMEEYIKAEFNEPETIILKESNPVKFIG